MKQTRHRKPFLMLTKCSEVIILNKKKIDITERILLEVRKWQ